jgi:hypothetical protein
MAPVHPQLDFLITASNPALESFELSHLNRRAILRKEAHEIMDKWADAEVEARFARWILDCRRAGNAGSFDRPSLAEHSPDLFPDSSPDTPPDAPIFSPVGGMSIPGPRRLAREIPQFSRRASESSPSAIAPVPGTQLALPLALAQTSPNRDAVDESRGGASVAASRARDAARTSRRDNVADWPQRCNISKAARYVSSARCRISADTLRNGDGEDPSEAPNLASTETLRYRRSDSDCAEAALRSLELRSHRNASDASSISGALTPASPRGTHTCGHISTSVRAILSPRAPHQPTKFFAAQIELFRKCPSRRTRSIGSRPRKPRTECSSFKSIAAQTPLFAKDLCRRTCPNNSEPFESSAAQTSSFATRPLRRTCSINSIPFDSSAAKLLTNVAAAQASSFTTRDALPTTFDQIAHARLAPKRKHAPRVRATNPFARQTSGRKRERRTRTLSQSHIASRSTPTQAKSRPQRQLLRITQKSHSRKAKRLNRNIRPSSAAHPFRHPRLFASNAGMIQQRARSAS